MKLYRRYLLKPFLVLLALVFPLLAGIYALIEFFDKLDNLTKAHLPLSYLFKYLLLRLPEICFDLWPIGLGLSALLAFAYLSRGGELLAFRTLGFSPRRLIWPYFWTALLLSVVFIGVEELIMPEAAYQARFFWETKVRKKEPKGLVLKGRLFFRGVNSFFIGQVINPEVTYLKNVIYARVNEEGLPETIIWAKRARFERGNWLFEDGILKEPSRGEKPFWFHKLKRKLEFAPQTVLVVKRTPRLQHLKELWAQRDFLLKAELPAIFTESELAYRLCYPLLGALLVPLSLPAILLERGRHALGKGLSLGTFAIIGGVGIFMAAKSLGDTGLISPFLSQALGIVTIGALGLFFLQRIKT